MSTKGTFSVSNDTFVSVEESIETDNSQMRSIDFKIQSKYERYQSAIAAFLYVSIGVILILSTKYILKTLEFPFPIFITACGQSFTSIIVRILVYYKHVIIRPEIQRIMSPKFLLTRIASIAFFATLALVLGNYAYLYLNVSLIQALKSFTPVAVMTLSFFILNLKITLPLFISICILTLGTLICTGDLWMSPSSDIDENIDDTSNATSGVNIFGVILMLFSALAEALKVVLTQKLLKGVYQNQRNEKEKNSMRNSLEMAQLIPSERDAEDLENQKEMRQKRSVDIKLSVHESMYYYAPISTLFMIVLILFFEGNEFMNGYDKYTQIIMDNFMIFILVSVLGYGVMISSFLVTKFFSGLYLKALSVCRNFILVLLVVYFGEIMTTFQVIGYTVSIIGFIYYNYVRLQQNK